MNFIIGISRYPDKAIERFSIAKLLLYPRMPEDFHHRNIAMIE